MVVVPQQGTLSLSFSHNHTYEHTNLGQPCMFVTFDVFELLYCCSIFIHIFLLLCYCLQQYTMTATFCATFSCHSVCVIFVTLYIAQSDPSGTAFSLNSTGKHCFLHVLQRFFIQRTSQIENLYSNFACSFNF